MKQLSAYSAPEQTALRTEICVDATDDQINYFLRVCAAKEIDPFSGLLYMQRRFVKASNKWKCSVQPTVDGSRAAAARTGQYGGSDEPEFDNEDAERPKWCRVTVYRVVKGVRCAFTSKCRWAEFVPVTPNDFQWKAKPFHMLAKCTEVQSLRKAFPELVSATGEDDLEVETITDTNQAPDPEKIAAAKLGVEWSNAVKAFASLDKKESDLLAYLKIPRDQVTPEHMEVLRHWYEEIIAEKSSVT